MSTTIRVAILEDHLATADGYVMRLAVDPEIEVVARMTYGEELEPGVAAHRPHVLLLDVGAPISARNPGSFPILHLIPKLLKEYPDLEVLVISMHNQRTLIRAVMETGASGYILKDDPAAIRELASVVRSVASGGIHLSPKAFNHLFTAAQSEGPGLSDRQREAISLAAAYPDASTGQLAEKMNIAPSTLRNTLSGAYIKLGVPNRGAAIAKAHQIGLIASDTGYPELPLADLSHSEEDAS